MNTQKILSSIAIVLGAASLFVAVALHRPSTVTTRVVTPAGNTVVKGISADFSNSPFINVGGVTEWYEYAPIKTGTTTLCSFPNPLVAYGGASTTALTASTTLQYAALHILTATAAFNGEIGTSTSGSGTTTDIVSARTMTTSNSIGYIASNWDNAVIPSNININFMANSTSTVTAGYCEAEFTQY